MQRLIAMFLNLPAVSMFLSVWMMESSFVDKCLLLSVVMHVSHASLAILASSVSRATTSMPFRTEASGCGVKDVNKQRE